MELPPMISSIASRVNRAQRAPTAEMSDESMRLSHQRTGVQRINNAMVPMVLMYSREKVIDIFGLRPSYHRFIVARAVNSL